MNRVEIVIMMMVTAVVSLALACTTTKRDPNEWFEVQVYSSADSSYFDPESIFGYPRVKIVGTINNNDFFKISTVQSLYHLDLSEATVVGHIVIAYQTDTTSQIVQTGNAIPAGAFGDFSISIIGVDTLNFTAHKNIRTIKFPRNLAAIGQSAFAGCGLNQPLDFPPSLIRIHDNAFDNCGYLIGELKLPESLIFLGNNVFSRCANLTGVLQIPNYIDSIAPYAFSNCIGFTEIVLHNRVRKIAAFAFAATTVSEINFPGSIIEIGAGAFRNCRNLSGSLALPSNLLSIGDSAFRYAGYDEKLVIPQSVRALGRAAFDSTKFQTIELNWTDSHQLPAWDTSQHWFADRFERSKYTHQNLIYIPAGTKDIYERHFAFEGAVFYNLEEKK